MSRRAELAVLPRVTRLWNSAILNRNPRECLWPTGAVKHDRHPRLGTSRPRLFAASILVACALLVAFALGPPHLSAQVSSARLIHVTVTDPLGRSVIGLDQDRFEVLRSAAACSITDFAGADSPMMLAIVSETQSSDLAALLRSEDELIQTRSLADAVQRLSASKKPRKVIVTTATSGAEMIPGSIQVVQANRADLAGAVDELGKLHQYLLWVKCSTSSANLNVVLDRPLGLPPLNLTWK